MSFRKRNLGISSGSTPPSTAQTGATPHTSPLPGLRPSPLDGRPTTSTGAATLDGLLAGHAGLALGTSLLIEESGTTDYAGALLRIYAAEGLVQGHHVHVVGLPEQWGRDLPGLVTKSEKVEQSSDGAERMKIAWRYESLSRFEAGANTRERAPSIARDSDHSALAPSAFCHIFDLTKKLAHPADSKMNFLQLEHHPQKAPFAPTLARLASLVGASDPNTVHRIILPTILSPALYPLHSSRPENVLQFLHGLKALLAAYQGRMSVMLSLSLSLYPRTSGLVRWIELLNDGVLELAPFPHSAATEVTSKNSDTSEEPPQGLLRIHRLPVFHEQGSGKNVAGDDWAFTLSRRKFVVKPFSLPPVEGDIQAQEAASSDQKSKTSDLDY